GNEKSIEAPECVEAPAATSDCVKDSPDPVNEQGPEPRGSKEVAQNSGQPIARCPDTVHQTAEKDQTRRYSIHVNAKRLREIRTRLALTQERMAAKCGVSVATIQRGERGEKWRLDTFHDVAQRLKEKADLEIKASELMAE